MITIVLLPGMDGTGTLFGPFVAALGPEFNVKVVSYPSTGRLGYAELDAVARAAMPTDGPFVILGESFSGPIAVALAASSPPGLRGLVLCCSFVRNPRPAFAPLNAMLGVLPLGVVPGRILSHFLLGRFSTPALRLALKQALAGVSPSALRARLRAVLSVDASAQLAAVKVPVLYLRAAQDRVVPRAASELIARRNPGARVVQIDGPHLLLQAMPEEAARVVEAFIRAAR